MCAATIGEPDLGRRNVMGTGPVLVATDGTSSADAAVRAAARLAERSDANIVVTTVLESLPLVPADYGLTMPPEDVDDARRRALIARVREHIARFAGP